MFECSCKFKQSRMQRRVFLYLWLVYVRICIDSCIVCVLCVYVYVCVCVYVPVYVSVCLCVCVCMCVHVSVCTCVYVPFYVRMYIRYRSFLSWNSHVLNRERAQFYRKTSIKTHVFCSFSRVHNCSRLGSRAYSRFFTSSLTSSFESYWYARGISLRAHSQTYTFISRVITRA